MLHLWICLVHCFESCGWYVDQVVASTWARDSHDLFDFEASQLQTFLAEMTWHLHRDHRVILKGCEACVQPSWLIKEVLHCPEFGQVCPLWYRCCALRFLTYIRVVRLAKTKCFGFPGPDAHRHWTSTSRLTWSQYVDRASKLWNFCLKLTYGFPSFPVIFSHSHNFSYMFLSFHFFEWQWRETRKPMKIRKENLTLNTS